jgi:ABC-type dipeptide/oligopeptide/nickel transport system permease component
MSSFRRYAVKRIAQSIPVILLIMTFVFLLIHLIPGNPAYVILGAQASEQQVKILEKQLGLDKPIHIQYLDWMAKVLGGDLGISVITDQPIAKELLVRFPITLSLVVYSLIIAVVVSYPLGVIAAVSRGTTKEYLVLLFSLFGLSVPIFWSSLILLLIFGVWLRLFTVVGFVSVFDNFWLGIRYLTLPAIALGTALAAINTRQIRSNMLDVLSSDYIVTAYAKGLSERTILMKHALKNAVIPSLTILGVQFGTLLGGTVLLEVVFTIPGMGRWIVSSIFSRDYPVVQACVLVIAVFVVFTNLAVDLLYGFIDPKITYEE